MNTNMKIWVAFLIFAVVFVGAFALNQHHPAETSGETVTVMIPDPDGQFVAEHRYEVLCSSDVRRIVLEFPPQTGNISKAVHMLFVVEGPVKVQLLEDP